MACDLQTGLGAGSLGVDMSEFTLEEVHLVLEGLRASYGPKPCVNFYSSVDVWPLVVYD